MKKIACSLIVTVILLASSVQSYANVTLGFATSPGPSSSSFNISNLGSSLLNLSFGNLSITTAADNGSSISELIGGEVVLNDVSINLGSEHLIGSFGPAGIYSYDLTSSILDGFSIFVGGNKIVEADVSYQTLVTLGKSGTIDYDVNYSLSNLRLDTTNITQAATISYLSQYLLGADMTLSLASDLFDLHDGFYGTQNITGVVGGTVVPNPVPEPYMFLMMGWGTIMLYTSRKINSKCK